MQGILLTRLKGSAHLVEVHATGTCSYAGKTWQTILLAPVARKLNCTDSLTVFSQVCDEHEHNKICCALAWHPLVWLGLSILGSVVDALNVSFNL